MTPGGIKISKFNFPFLYNPSEVYLGFRRMVFDLPSREYVPSDRLGNVAVVVEEGSDDGAYCHSLVAVADGSASLYFSNGGGVIGAGEHANVSKLAKELVDYSSNFAKHLDRWDRWDQRAQWDIGFEPPLPSPAMVRVSIISKGGGLSSEFPEDELKCGQSPLSDFYLQSVGLIGEIKLIAKSFA